MVSDELIGHRDETSEHAVYAVVLELDVLITASCHLDRGVQQNDTEDICHPRELSEHGGADRNEDPAKYQRANDPPQQRSIMQCGWHAEKAENDYEHENVVDRE